MGRLTDVNDQTGDDDTNRYVIIKTTEEQQARGIQLIRMTQGRRQKCHVDKVGRT